MPFIFRNLTLTPHDGESSLAARLAAQLELPAAVIRNLTIVRKAIDARRKGRIKLIYTVSFEVGDRAVAQRLARHKDLEWQEDARPQPVLPVRSGARIVIVGSGPAGLFAALRLSEYGLTATLLERGEAVEARSRTVQRFWKDGTLNPQSNVQFGEGGAGTFSDGKLTCRTKGEQTPWILEKLVQFGAQPEIRYLAKPHIGTDRLRTVVSAIRSHLLERGFTIRFTSCMTDLTEHGGRAATVIVNDREELPCDHLILACGHSARDTYELLERRGIPLQRKPFALGVRVEHPQEAIDRIQYGTTTGCTLPAADYAVTWNNATTGRSAYSFCMCPGGVVVAGASEPGGVVTNGMSGQLRNSPFANSALVVNIREEDFMGDGPLGGVRLQRHWEHLAFAAGGGSFRAPAQNMLDFLQLPGGRPVSSSYRPGITPAELSEVLPPYVAATLREGIADFGRKLRGFVSAEATLIGIESRTSAPVRILRNEGYESIGLEGLYPAGEGAGYAGGIMSSAIDGIRIADTIAGKLRSEQGECRG